MTTHPKYIAVDCDQFYGVIGRGADSTGCRDTFKEGMAAYQLAAAHLHEWYAERDIDGVRSAKWDNDRDLSKLHYEFQAAAWYLHHAKPYVLYQVQDLLSEAAKISAIRAADPDSVFALTEVNFIATACDALQDIGIRIQDALDAGSEIQQAINDISTISALAVVDPLNDAQGEA